MMMTSDCPLLCAPAEGARIECTLLQKARLHRNILATHYVLCHAAAESRDICTASILSMQLETTQGACPS
jgi:hypothetical protein